MYEAFLTNPDLEKNGVILDFGNFRVTIARAGGFNQMYQKVATEVFRPVRRAVDSGTLPDEQARALLAEVYSRAVIKRWETMIDGQWQAKLAMLDGTFVDYSPQAVASLLKMPEFADLFAMIMNDATKNDLFRREIREAEAKN
jgi:hypothetical protein